MASDRYGEVRSRAQFEIADPSIGNLRVSGVSNFGDVDAKQDEDEDPILLPPASSAARRPVAAQCATRSSLKTVPMPAVPPWRVVPYRWPSLAWINAPLGCMPSLAVVPKEYNTVSTPEGVIL